MNIVPLMCSNVITFTDYKDGTEVNKRLQQIREDIRSM